MFTIVERTPAEFGRWFVLDDHGEERGRYYLFNAALLFATQLTSEANEHEARKAEARQEATQAEASQMLAEMYRRGQADAYRHVGMRLSFLLGGTLPRGGADFRRELATLLTSIGAWEAEAKVKADAIKGAYEARIEAKVERIP